MARRIFYSIHHKPDNWKASQVRIMGVIGGNRPYLNGFDGEDCCSIDWWR